MLKKEELEKQITEISTKIRMYYDYKYSKKGYDNPRLTFIDFVRREHIDLTSRVYSQPEPNSLKSSIVIYVSDEDFIIRMYYGVQTEIIYKMTYEEVKSVYKNPIKYIENVQWGGHVFEKEIPKSNKKTITKKIVSCYNQKIRNGEVITLESLLFELEELRTAMREKSKAQGIERGEIEFGNLESFIECRNYKIMLIDGVYNTVTEKLSKRLSVEYLDQIRMDFNNAFGYDKQMINTVVGRTKNK